MSKRDSHRISNVYVFACHPVVHTHARTHTHTQDFFYPMGSIAGSSAEGQTIAFDYMTSHWGKIRARVSKASASLTNAVISSCCAGFTTAAKADEIEAFFVANPCECATRRITQLLEGMRNTAKFVDTHISGSPLAEDGFWAGLTGSVIEACEV